MKSKCNMLHLWHPFGNEEHFICKNLYTTIKPIYQNEANAFTAEKKTWFETVPNFAEWCCCLFWCKDDTKTPFPLKFKRTMLINRYSEILASIGFFPAIITIAGDVDKSIWTKHKISAIITERKWMIAYVAFFFCFSFPMKCYTSFANFSNWKSIGFVFGGRARKKNGGATQTCFFVVCALFFRPHVRKPMPTE